MCPTQILTPERVNPLPDMPFLGFSNSAAKKKYDFKNMDK